LSAYRGNVLQESGEKKMKNEIEMKKFVKKTLGPLLVEKLLKVIRLKSLQQINFFLLHNFTFDFIHKNLKLR
jgi:hypothetical protein